MRRINLKMELEDPAGNRRIVKARGWQELVANMQLGEWFRASDTRSAISCATSCYKKNLKVTMHRDPNNVVRVWRVACFLLAFITAGIAQAQTCPTRVYLKSASSTARGERIIYKSNWNIEQGRELRPSEGNDAQKGAAFLIYYKASEFIPPKNVIEVRDRNCKKIARMGRFPRCTSFCGEHERWYLRGPGGSHQTVQRLAEIAQGPVLIRMKGRQWAVVQNIFNDRESYK